MDQLPTGMHLQIVQNPTKNNAPHLKRQCLLSSRRKQENQRSASCFVENNMQMAGLLRWPRLWRKASVGYLSLVLSICAHCPVFITSMRYLSQRTFRPVYMRTDVGLLGGLRRVSICYHIAANQLTRVIQLNVVTICDCLGTIKLEFVYSERLIHHLQ